MAYHRMEETLEGLFERRCSESGVSFEEEARELEIPAGALREKLSGRDGFKKPEAERVGEFIRPTNPMVSSQLVKLGPHAARMIDANLRNEEFLRLATLPEEEREAEFQRDPGLREDFEEYGEELGAEPTSELRGMVDAEIRRRGAENLSPDELASIINDAIEQETQRKVDEVAARAGESLRRLIKEQRYKARTWKPISYFRELADIRKTRFAQIEKGETDFRLSEIVRCSIALGVSPSVVIGDITEEEWRLVEQLRGMGDSDRELVKSLIERLGSGTAEGK